MSSRIFVDTLFVVAQINQRDQYHKKASELADQFEGYPLLVTDAVLLEIGNALHGITKRKLLRSLSISLLPLK